MDFTPSAGGPHSNATASFNGSTPDGQATNGAASNGSTPKKTAQGPTVPVLAASQYEPRIIEADKGERATLRGMIGEDGDMIDHALRHLKPEFWQNPEYRVIAEAVWTCHARFSKWDAQTIESFLLSEKESDAAAAIHALILPMPEPSRNDFHDAAHTVLNWKKTAASTSHIPAPQLTSDKGAREYAPRQIVALLYPDWEHQNITSQAAHARRVRDVLGDNLRYCPQLGWLGYTGKSWETDDKSATATAERAATLGATVSKESAGLFDCAAALARDGRAQDADAMSRAAVALLRHVKQCETRNFIDGALHFAAGDATKIRVAHTAFDQKPWVIGFQNGTWAQGQWGKHRRDDYLTHLSPVSLDAKADQSEWLQVLARITGGDPDFALTLLDIAGYVLSGASHLRVLPWAYGPKGTGKSTFSELLKTVLGTMAATVDPKLLDKDAVRERLGAVLWNRRLAICAEAGNQRIDSELLKALSGGDALPVRFLFREGFDTPPRHVLLMVANDAPRLDAYDDALRDRVVALPFVHRLDADGPLELTGGARIEAVRQDPYSPLVRGFAAWAMEGLARVYQTESIHRAACIEAATAKFWSDTDPLTSFWESIEESDLLAGIGKTELRKKYEEWCDNEGVHKNARMNRTSWIKACDSHGLKDVRRTGGKRFWVLEKPAKVTQVTQVPLISKGTRKEEKEVHELSEKIGTCVTCVTFEREISDATQTEIEKARESGPESDPEIEMERFSI
jgi:P4 family phage/plasmid primase-like protien